MSRRTRGVCPIRELLSNPCERTWQNYVNWLSRNHSPGRARVALARGMDQEIKQMEVTK